jgi:hypothetical protein
VANRLNCLLVWSDIIVRNTDNDHHPAHGDGGHQPQQNNPARRLAVRGAVSVKAKLCSGKIGFFLLYCRMDSA